MAPPLLLSVFYCGYIYVQSAMVIKGRQVLLSSCTCLTVCATCPALEVHVGKNTGRMWSLCTCIASIYGEGIEPWVFSMCVIM